MTFDVLNVMYAFSRKRPTLNPAPARHESCGVGECAVSADTVAEALLH